MLPAEPFRHLSYSCALHIQCEGAASFVQSFPGGCTTDEDIAADDPAKMNLDRPVRPLALKFTSGFPCDLVHGRGQQEAIAGFRQVRRWSGLGQLKLAVNPVPVIVLD